MNKELSIPTGSNSRYNLPAHIVNAILRYPGDVEKQVLSILRFHGMAPKRKHRPHRRYNLNLIIQLYHKFQNFSKVARVLDCSPSLVYYHVKRYNTINSTKARYL